MINYNIKIENLQIHNLTINNINAKKKEQKRQKKQCMATDVTPVTYTTDATKPKEKLNLLDKPTEKKITNLKIADAYVVLKNINKASRMSQCFTYLEYLKAGENMRLIFANSCHVRLCPACNWRRSLKIYRENRLVFDYIKNCNETPNFIFLTLTCRNMADYKLQDEVSEIINAFHIMFKYKRIKEATVGYARALEVTYNKDTKEYHPHIHVLINVCSNYFGREYIHQAEYAEMWQKALKVDYMPIVDVRKFKVKRVGFEGKELAEISKYCVKSADLIQNNVFETAKVVGTIDNAIANKRLIGYSGTFKEARSELNITTKNQEDFDDEDESDDKDIPEDARKIIYEWHFGQSKYIEKQVTDE